MNGSSKLLARWLRAQLFQSIREQLLTPTKVGAVGIAWRLLAATVCVQVCHSFDNGVGADVVLQNTVQHHTTLTERLTPGH